MSKWKLIQKQSHQMWHWNGIVRISLAERSCLTSPQLIRIRAANEFSAHAFPVWPTKRRVLQMSVCHLEARIDNNFKLSLNSQCKYIWRYYLYFQRNSRCIWSWRLFSVNAPVIATKYNYSKQVTLAVVSRVWKHQSTRVNLINLSLLGANKTKHAGETIRR